MRVKRVFVAPELITTMLTTGFELAPGIKVNVGIPDGAVLVAVGWDVAARCYAFDFEYQGWENVLPGVTPPILSIVIEKSSPLLSDSLSE